MNVEISGHEDLSEDPYQLLFVVSDTRDFTLYDLADATVESAIAFYPTDDSRGDNWNSWRAGRFRKLMKRLKPSKFDTLHEELSREGIEHYLYEKDNVKMITVSPQVKSFNPPFLKRAQVSGLTLLEDSLREDDLSSKYTIVMNSDVNMSSSKASVAASHAAQLLKEALAKNGERVSVSDVSVVVGSIDESDFLCVRDAGLTEVEKGSITASVRKSFQ